MSIRGPKESSGFIPKLENVRGTCRALLVLFLATIASGCGSIQRSGSENPIYDITKARALAALGVKSEGKGSSTRFKTVEGKSVGGVTACIFGDTGNTNAKARMAARKNAMEAGIIQGSESDGLGDYRFFDETEGTGFDASKTTCSFVPEISIDDIVDTEKASLR